MRAGAADLGILGKDVLLERSPDVYEPAGPGVRPLPDGLRHVRRRGSDPAALEHLGVVRVATKYPITAAAHFTATGRQAEVVKVNGLVELALLVGLAHGIVDLVATGRTLRENGLPSEGACSPRLRA